MEEKIYLTDNNEEIEKRIENRKSKFYPNLEKDWGKLEASYYKTGEGEDILQINGLEVMGGFQTPYMQKLADISTLKGGNILNVGFGLGLADSFIEDFRVDRKINEHHIIELNEDVFEKAEKWKEAQEYSDKITIHKGNWKDVVKDFNIQFDGILYDAYPLKKEDLCRDFIPFLKALMKQRLIKENEGIITFFFDSSEGFGEQFISLAQNHGVNSLSYEKVNVQLPRTRKSETWEKDFFLAPKLTKIKYKMEIKEVIEQARKELLSNHSEYLKAETKLASEANGFFDKSLFDEMLKAKKKWQESSNKFYGLLSHLASEKK